MFNREIIDEMICSTLAHGDNSCDIRNLAMLYFVREHMDEKIEHLTRKQAEDWVKGMHGKWSMEQVKPFADKLGFTDRIDEFWPVMNAMYSDYAEMAKKYGTEAKPEFFADMAAAWLNDDDAVKDKAAKYLKHIVKM